MAAIWTAITTAVTNFMTYVGDVATTIASNEILLLFAIVLPVVSFAVGLLIRLLKRA